MMPIFPLSGMVDKSIWHPVHPALFAVFDNGFLGIIAEGVKKCFGITIKFCTDDADLL